MGTTLSTAKLTNLTNSSGTVHIDLGEDLSSYSMPNEVLLKSGGYTMIVPLNQDIGPTEQQPIVWNSYRRTPNSLDLNFQFLPTHRHFFMNNDYSATLNFHGYGNKTIEVFPGKNYISVYKPWYSTWWGILIIVLLIVLLLMLILAFPIAILTGYCPTSYSLQSQTKLLDTDQWVPQSLPYSRRGVQS